MPIRKKPPTRQKPEWLKLAEVALEHAKEARRLAEELPDQEEFLGDVATKLDSIGDTVRLRQAFTEPQRSAIENMARAVRRAQDFERNPVDDPADRYGSHAWSGEDCPELDPTDVGTGQDILGRGYSGRGYTGWDYPDRDNTVIGPPGRQPEDDLPL